MNAFFNWALGSDIVLVVLACLIVIFSILLAGILHSIHRDHPEDSE